MSTILFGVFFVGLFVGLPVSISMGLSGMAAVLDRRGNLALALA